MNPEQKKCERIKKLVEVASGFENIGQRTRKRPVPELKKIYSKLCKTFTSASLSTIGQSLGGYDHATALHAITTFDNLLESNGLDCLDLYKELFDKLNKEKSLLAEAEGKGEIPLTIPELHQKFRISLIKIIEKGHSIINRKEERIKKLEPLLEELLELTDPANPKERNDLSKYFSLRAKINSLLLKK